MKVVRLTMWKIEDARDVPLGEEAKVVSEHYTYWEADKARELIYQANPGTRGHLSIAGIERWQTWRGRYEKERWRLKAMREAAA